MRFLADESCDGAVIRALRLAGYDVTAVHESMPGAADQAVIEAALADARLLITEDKDFGDLVFARGAPAVGVLLLRYPVAARSRVVRRILDFAAVRTVDLVGSFVVIGPSRVRVRRLGR